MINYEAQTLDTEQLGQPSYEALQAETENIDSAAFDIPNTVLAGVENDLAAISALLGVPLAETVLAPQA